MRAGEAEAVSHSMMCLSFEHDANPLAVTHTRCTKCECPRSVADGANAPDAASRCHVRTDASRLPVTTVPSERPAMVLTSCSCPARPQ